MNDAREFWTAPVGARFGVAPWEMERVSVFELSQMIEYARKAVL